VFTAACHWSLSWARCFSSLKKDNFVYVVCYFRKKAYVCSITSSIQYARLHGMAPNTVRALYFNGKFQRKHKCWFYFSYRNGDLNVDWMSNEGFCWTAYYSFRVRTSVLKCIWYFRPCKLLDLFVSVMKVSLLCGRNVAVLSCCVECNGLWATGSFGPEMNLHFSSMLTKVHHQILS
jgi:hypothetical protein